MYEDLTQDKKRELLARTSKGEMKVEEPLEAASVMLIIAALEGLSPDERLANYIKIKPALLQLRALEREVALKRIAKMLGVSVQVIRAEFAAEDETAATIMRQPRWIAGDGSFIPPVLAKHLMDKSQFVYDRNLLYFYQQGYYQQQGYQTIKARCIDLMRNEYRDAHGNEVAKYIETALWSPKPVLDTNARYINVENGLLDWMADPPQLLPHDPDYLSSIRIPVRYDPEATCLAIDQFFQDVLPEDCMDLAYELFGYCLIPDTSFQKAFMVLGSGANGKSVFISLLQTFIGKANCSSESLQDLAENRFRVASLVGKLINTFSDLPSRMLEDTSLFKALVSGDTLSAERKGEQAFEFKNHARLVFSANELPRTKDLSHGFFRRWCIIRFANSFPEGSAKRDPAILSKLTTEKELSGLLNQAIAGLVRLFSQREFTKPESTETELRMYQSENDNVRIFFDECCVLTIGALTPKDQLYRSYEKWCHAGNFRAISRQKFNKHILTVFPSVSEDTHGVRRWKGIAEIIFDTETKK